MVRTWRLLAALTTCVLIAPTAAAQSGDVAAAARAYSRAQEAEIEGDFAEAAQLYEMADRIAPTVEALRSAIRARREAGHDAMAAGHAETLLRRHAEDEEARELGQEVLGELQGELTRFLIQCSAPCQILLDGQATSVSPAEEHIVYATPGTHQVAATIGGETTEEQEVTGEGGDRQELSFDAPAAEEPVPGEEEEERRGLSPWFTFGGSLITVGVAVGAIFCGVQVLELHAEYDRGGEGAQDAFDRGRDWELATNLLIAGTAVVGVATLAVAIFWTDWARLRREPTAMRSGPIVAAGRGGSFLLGWSGYWP